MKLNLKPLVLAAALAASSLAVLAQPAGGPPPEGGPGAHQPGPEHRARMREHMGKHVAELKAKLKLTPEQEGSWKTYLASMKPANPPAPPKHEEIAKLTTPERLDRMRAMRQQHAAEFDKRDEATRTFYAGLSAEQKKVFDDSTARPFHPEGRRQAPAR